ncbi:MAG TPA: low specificity L-threonine aldolase [Abditibacterium sp.]|jgi:threonine aldolase
MNLESSLLAPHLTAPASQIQGAQDAQIGSEGVPLGIVEGDLRRQFASDNYAGICPEAWAALEAANCGHAPGYGDDVWTLRATNALRELFETDCEVFFVFNGTAANSLALASMCRSYHSILCHNLAHIETDECGAPEFFSNGTKVLLLPGQNGKIDASAIERTVKRRTDLHYPKPQVVSLTQATECGTIYTPDEVGAVGEAAKSLGLRVHMDGARFANAVASLGCAPAEVTWRAGVDVLCFGATKNGVPVGEAVVFFDTELAREFDYRCKQAGQLASKMRFLSAPWLGLLQDGAWLRRASHANAMAQLLETQLRAALPDLTILFPRQVNSLFVSLPPAVEAAMHARGWRFYNFIGAGGCRLMCSWDTRPEDIEALVGDLVGCWNLERDA